MTQQTWKFGKAMRPPFADLVIYFESMFLVIQASKDVQNMHPHGAFAKMCLNILKPASTFQTAYELAHVMTSALVVMMC